MLDSDERPWGRWEEYLNEFDYRVKRLIINPGKRFSLQKHEKRSEHWVVVQGSGIVTISSETKQIKAGDSVFIACAAIHRLENCGDKPLIVIETQIGTCLEDDIIRLEDDWDRS